MKLNFLVLATVSLWSLAGSAQVKPLSTAEILGQPEPEKPAPAPRLQDSCSFKLPAKKVQLDETNGKIQKLQKEVSSLPRVSISPRVQGRVLQNRDTKQKELDELTKQRSKLEKEIADCQLKKTVGESGYVPLDKRVASSLGDRRKKDSATPGLVPLAPRTGSSSRH